jgi:hypothetical protein
VATKIAAEVEKGVLCRKARKADPESSRFVGPVKDNLNDLSRGTGNPKMKVKRKPPKKSRKSELRPRIG